MPTNRYTAEIIQSISPDELEFQEYINRQLTPTAKGSRDNSGQSEPGKIYHCLCGYTLVVGKLRCIPESIFYDNNGNSVDRCPKCDRVLGGVVKKVS
jgi:hypothetical protein